MKNTKEEKSKQHHKKPEPLNVEARWGKLFSVPMLHITVPEQYVKDILEVTDKIIADPDAIDHSSQLAGKIYKGKQLSVPLNYNKKVINFQNFTQKCCEAYVKEVREYDSNASRIWKEFTLNIMDLWVVSQYEGDYNPPHTHGGLLSGILYLKVPEQINEKSEPSGWLALNGWLPYRPESLQIKMNEMFLPKVADFYIFPSWQSHEVFPFKGKGERRSLSFNLSGEPKGAFFKNK